MTVRGVRPFDLLLGVIMILMGLSGIYGARLVVAAVQGPLLTAPFHYESDIALPAEDEVCAGETVEWPVIVHLSLPETLDGEGYVLSIFKTLWSVDGNFTAVRADAPQYAIWTGEQGTVIRHTEAFTLPDDLPPGRYEVRYAGGTGSLAVSVLRVPFTVLPCAG
jgi:hypothetical protein